MLKQLIEEVDRIQRTRIRTIDVNPKNDDTSIQGPDAGRSGIYFFYTSYSMTELSLGMKAPTRSAVPIPMLAEKFGSLDRLHQPDAEGFHLVYNGIGGCRGPKYDLRSRILQEISCTAERTGSLCIRQTVGLDDLSRWRYAYVTLADSAADLREADVQLPWNFAEHGKNVEVGWRLHYGWPLLCRY